MGRGAFAGCVLFSLSFSGLAVAEGSYNLSDDLTAREQTSAKLVGGSPYQRRVRERFVVVAPRINEGPAFASSLSFFEQTLSALLHERFEAVPAEAMTVYLFPRATEYEAYCKKTTHEKCISSFGYYSPGDRSLVMNVGPGIGTLSHEVVHPLMEANFTDVPIWFNEGVASLYEGIAFTGPNEIRGRKNWRHPRLATALSGKARSRALASTLFGMSDDTFRGANEDLNYATARYLCMWLEQKGLLWKFYREFKSRKAKDDATGALSFAKIVGRSPREVDDEWSKWVLAL